MLYAKVVLGLPIEGPFDYIIPPDLCKKAIIGSRVWVSFGSKRMLGYLVGISKKTSVKKLKPLSEIIDFSPVLDKNLLLLTKSLSDYYCCSWGQAIEAALPESIRKGKPLPAPNGKEIKISKKTFQTTLVQESDVKLRWDFYLKQIKQALTANQSVIFLSPSIQLADKAAGTIHSALNFEPIVLRRKGTGELERWNQLRQPGPKVVLGVRSAIFSPLKNLGLIIVDEEQNPSYKQDQVPHYHAREAAKMRAALEMADLILGSKTPSLETWYLADGGKITYKCPVKKDLGPQVKIISTAFGYFGFKQKSGILSKYLEDFIFSALTSKQKILLFLNRKGFATLASCLSCRTVLKCPRCNVNLVYHFEENILSCHYCNFKQPAPKICPHCNSGYIKYSGMGTEKIESELSRIFPQARIKMLDARKDSAIEENHDIFIGTESIIGALDYRFDLVAVLSIDNSLNRVDFRASEKTFGLLTGLLEMAKNTLVVQTSLPNNFCFKALTEKNADLFYKEELAQRKQLKFPPFKHIGLIKLRGKEEERSVKAGNFLHEKMEASSKSAGIEIVSSGPAAHFKLRGNFYWNILLKAASVSKLNKYIKKHLKDFRHSGIMVTVDIDPM